MRREKDNIVWPERLVAWGKRFVPFAERLVPAVLLFFCTFYHPAIVWLIFLFFALQLYQGMMWICLVRRNNPVNENKKYDFQRVDRKGAVLFTGGLFVLLLFPNMPLLLSNLCILFLMVVCILVWLKWIRLQFCPLTGRENRKFRWKFAIGVCFILYLLAGALLPYIRQPEVSMDFQNSFDAKQFYGEGGCCDRAAILEDNGEALRERIRMIEHAQKSILLSTFDFHTDSSGKQMLAALKAAAERGVQVRILMDGFNSWLRMTGNAYFYSLASDDNVTVKLYNPVNPLLPWRAMSRMHDKYLIVDDSLYLLGGRNIYDYFLGDQKGHKNYDRDVLIYNTGGKESSLNQVRGYFEEIWDSSLCQTWNDSCWISYIPAVRRARDELAVQYTGMKQKHADWFEPVDYHSLTMETNRITLLSNPTGLYSKEPQVFYGLCELMRQADHEVLWHTPYLICNDWMYEKLGEVAETVPSVNVMTNSVANNGNPFGAVDYALHKNEILNTGITVQEYEGGISYHGKSAVVDEELAIVGSFNIDMKSTYQDTELMLVIHSKEVSCQLKQKLLSYQQEAVTASRGDGEVAALYAEDASGMEKLQRSIIKYLNPALRFLF